MGYIILGTVLLLILLLLTRHITLNLGYDGEFKAVLQVLFFSFDLMKKREKKPKKPKKQKKAPEAEQVQSEPAKKEKTDVGAVFEAVETVGKILPKFLGRMKLKASHFHVTVGGEDASHTAILCGTYKAAAALLFSIIDEWCILEKGAEDSVSIEPNFLSEETEVNIKLRFRIRIISALGVALSFLMKFIKMKINQEKSKGIKQ